MGDMGPEVTDEVLITHGCHACALTDEIPDTNHWQMKASDDIRNIPATGVDPSAGAVQGVSAL